MKSRSVSITGATGFLGWHVAERFRDAGWQVKGIVRPDSTNPLPPGVERVVARLDVRDLSTACAGSDVIVHSAGLIRSAGSGPFQRINVDGTRAAVAAANASGARLVHVSSLAAIGPSSADRPNDEDDRSHPVTEYGRSKWESEEVVRREATTSWTILRPGSVYGPRDRQFLTLFRLGARGRFLLATRPGAKFTLIHVDDVAGAVFLAAQSLGAERSAFFIGHPQPSTASDVLRAIAGAVGRPYRPTNVPALFLTLAAGAGELGWRLGLNPAFDASRLAEFRAGSFVCSVTRAHERFGFVAATSLDAGMAATWRWYVDQGWV